MKPLMVGDIETVTRSYTAADMQEFARLAQLDQAPAEVPEPLIAALFSYLLGEELPGYGTNYLKQEMAFHSLAPLDEPLTASVEITRIRADKYLVDLKTECRRANGELICSGRALVLAKDTGRIAP